MGVGHYQNMRWLMEDYFENTSRTFTSQIARQAVSSLYSEDVDQLRLLASQSLFMPSLESVTFFNQSGKKIFSSIPDSNAASMTFSGTTGSISSLLASYSQGIVIREPILLTAFDPETLKAKPAQTIGEVVLGFSHANLELKLSGIRNALMLAEAFLGLIAGLAMFFLERWVTKPLINLISKIQNLAGGDLSVRVEVPKSAGEITTLCTGVNLMADSLEKHRLHLERLNAELEQRVHDRTAQLESANKELEAFSYSVSHDLRAPLRGIDGWSHALLEDYGEILDKQGHQYLERVRLEAQRMGQLIDGLLQLSRVTRSQIQPVTVDLTGIAQNIAARIRENLPDRKLEFSIEPGLTALGDATLLEIVLFNFLDNACKFTSLCDQARIEFGRTEEAGRPAFFVRDNGVGFDMAYVDKLFGAFQRLHKASEFPGTGIGLATVARIIHRHGGRVWSMAQPGKGAVFYFTIAEGKWIPK